MISISDFHWHLHFNIFQLYRQYIFIYICALVAVSSSPFEAVRFEVSRKENSRLLWRPNQVQASGLRATNAASFYAHSTLSASQGLLQAGGAFWRFGESAAFPKLASQPPIKASLAPPATRLPSPGFPATSLTLASQPHTLRAPQKITIALEPVLQVWRMRAHKSEKSLCAAKPLWFLARQLKVPKGMVQRIV